MNYKIRLILGFRKDQEHSIDANEAHKGYYLFLNPEKRAVFSNGLALKGSDIQAIIPDWQGTMGWNPTHILDGYDWNEIRSAGVEENMRKILSHAKEIAVRGNNKELSAPLLLD